MTVPSVAANSHFFVRWTYQLAAWPTVVFRAMTLGWILRKITITPSSFVFIVVSTTDVDRRWVRANTRTILPDVRGHWMDNATQRECPLCFCKQIMLRVIFYTTSTSTLERVRHHESRRGNNFFVFHFVCFSIILVSNLLNFFLCLELCTLSLPICFLCFELCVRFETKHF